MRPKQFLFLFVTTILIFLTGICMESKAQKKVNSVQKTVEELSENSDLVVVGKVSRIHSDWNKNKTRIYTSVTVDVEDFVKGSGSGTSIVVTHPGGEVGDVGELYSHTPRFKPSEEVMLFLHKNKNGNLNVTRGVRGKFILKSDKASNRMKLQTGESIENIKAMVKNKPIK